MRSSCICLVFVFVAALGSLVAQDQNASPVIPRDPEALSVIGHAISAAGGLSAIAGIQDFSADGTISYHEAGKVDSGEAQIKARGRDQFRMDASLPAGMRSWSVSNGVGELKNAQGKKSEIPRHNALSLGALTFPYLNLLNALNDASTEIDDEGLVTVNNSSYHKVHVHRILFASAGANDAINQLLDCDYLFDPQTGLLSVVQNQTHPVTTMTRDVPRELDFSDYRAVNGVMVPFSITESIGRQTIWTLQLTSVDFNTGLADSDFSLQ